MNKTQDNKIHYRSINSQSQWKGENYSWLYKIYFQLLVKQLNKKSNVRSDSSNLWQKPVTGSCEQVNELSIYTEHEKLQTSRRTIRFSKMTLLHGCNLLLRKPTLLQFPKCFNHDMLYHNMNFTSRMTEIRGKISRVLLMTSTCNRFMN